MWTTRVVADRRGPRVVHNQALWTTLRLCVFDGRWGASQATTVSFSVRWRHLCATLCDAPPHCGRAANTEAVSAQIDGTPCNRVRRCFSGLVSVKTIPLRHCLREFNDPRTAPCANMTCLTHPREISEQRGRYDDQPTDKGPDARSAGFFRSGHVARSPQGD